MRLAQDTQARQQRIAMGAAGASSTDQSASAAVSQQLATSRVEAASAAQASKSALINTDIVTENPQLAQKIDDIEQRLAAIEAPQ